MLHACFLPNIQSLAALSILFFLNRLLSKQAACRVRSPSCSWKVWAFQGLTQ